MDIQKLLNRKSARKEARKTKKKLTKIVKVAHTRKINPDEAVSEFLNKGKKKKNNQKKRKSKTKVAKAARIAAKVQRELEDGDSEEESYFKELKQTKKEALKEGIDVDDFEIKKYEKLLGLDKKKSKNVPKTIVEDGLSDLWEFCDPTKRQKYIEEDDENDLGTRQLAENKEDEEMIDLNEDDKKSRKRKHVEVSSDDEGDSVAEDFDEDEDFDQEMDTIDDFLFNKEDSEIEEEVNDEVAEDEDIEGEGEDEDEDDIEAEDLDEDDVEAENENAEESQFKEDIYGRKIDVKTGKVVEEGSTTRALQKLEELNKNDPAIAEQRFKIGKTLRGAVNRLNERTMVSGIKTVEELFNTSSHNDVKAIFYETFLKATQTVYALPDRLLIEYAMFIALAHVNVSPEISSHFVESLSLYLVKEMESDRDSDDKALENATALLCHLYNFKVIKAEFMIDLMTKMRNCLREKTVTLMMCAITFSGTNLKKRMTTQFAIWDRIKEIENIKKRQRINLAFLTADLIQMEAVSLAVLKIVNFGVIDVTTTAFLKRVFYRLFLKCTNSALIEMFKKITKSESLKLLIDGLKLFFEISMKPESFDEPDAGTVIKRINLVREILSNAD